MKFIKTRITFEKLTERVIESSCEPCPNCGYSQSLFEQMSRDRHGELNVPPAIATLETAGSSRAKENQNE